jgi:hypothetical protein
MTPKQQVIQALKCADADLLGVLQRAKPGWSPLDRHDSAAIRQTREEITDAISLVELLFPDTKPTPAKKR